MLLLCLFSMSSIADLHAAATTKAKTAAEAKAEKQLSLEEETDALVEKLKANREEVNTKRSEFKNTEGDERMIIGTQLLDLHEKTRDMLDELLDNINKLKEANIDANRFIATGKNFSTEQTTSLREELQHLRELITAHEKKREQAKANDLFELEQQISEAHDYLVKTIRAFVKHIQRLETFELDFDEQQDFIKTQLDELAKDSAAKLKLNASDLSNTRDGLSQSGKSQDPDLIAELSAYEEREASLTSMLRTFIGLMKDMEMETADYSLALIRSAGEVDSSLLEKDVFASLMNQWISEAKDWLIDNTGNLLTKLISVILILFAFHLLALLAEKVVRHFIVKSGWDISKLLQDFVQNMTAKLVFFIGILVALSYLGVEIGHLLAGLGVAGFIIGFALQDTLSNFASGMMILIYRPYDVGDTIEAAGQMGLVKNMNLVSTTLHTFDNQQLIIPNNKIWGDIIRNVTSQDKRRVDGVFTAIVVADTAADPKSRLEVINHVAVGEK